MSDLGDFLVGIAPELIKLGQQLFDAHDGNLTKARLDIADRRVQIADNRAKRDAELAAKYGPQEE